MLNFMLCQFFLHITQFTDLLHYCALIGILVCFCSKWLVLGQELLSVQSQVKMCLWRRQVEILGNYLLELLSAPREKGLLSVSFVAAILVWHMLDFFMWHGM